MDVATIVFCDIVGFSRRNDEELRKLTHSLNAEVAHELHLHLFEIRSSPAIICLPTGDGMAIALLGKDPTAWAPVLFSLLDRLVRWAKHNGKLRMGVHFGPVSVIADINHHPNICGTSVNDAQRIMDAAHPNQVLFSEAAFRAYVGYHGGSYRNHPFSEQAPAQFKGQFDIIAKHGLAIPVYSMYRPEDPAWVAIKPQPREVIIGKLLRTQLIGDELARLAENKERNLCIYEQSAFSTFAMGTGQEARSDSAKRSQRRTDDGEYIRASKRQRQLLGDLAGEKHTTLKLILHPVRAFKPPLMYARLTQLLEWMKDPAISSNDRIDFVMAEYDGPNRFIVKDEFSIEGFKLHDTPGYGFSMIYRDEYRIDEAISSFDRVFRQAKEEGSTKRKVIAEIKARRAKYAPRSRAGRTSAKKR